MSHSIFQVKGGFQNQRKFTIKGPEMKYGQMKQVLRLNSVLPKKICLSPNSQYFKNVIYLDIRLLLM